MDNKCKTLINKEELISHIMKQDFKNKLILITGGCGFIGSNLIGYLLRKTDWKIVILDNMSYGKPEDVDVIEGFKERVKIIDGDIRNKDDVANAIQDCDFVVNLAAQTDVISSIKDPFFDEDVNIKGTLILLDACRKNKIIKFVQASSVAPLGEQEMPLDENKVPKPLSPYGASKLAGEAYCGAFSASFDMNTVLLRFSNVYGPKSYEKGSVIPLFIRQIKDNKQVIIFGDGEQTRDFIHVEDVCQAIYLSLTVELKESFEIFQIATGEETSLNKLFDLIKNSFKEKDVDVKEPKYEPVRPGEILRNYSDISKARKLLGFDPKIGLREGIKMTLDWFYRQKI